MNKSDLINQISENNTPITKKEAGTLLNAALKAISDALASGEDVSLAGFGTFSVKERAAREGRNPFTGETINIAASKVPVFKPGKALKDAVK